MKKFEKPEVVVTELNIEDVITTSGNVTCPVKTPDEEI